MSDRSYDRNDSRGRDHGDEDNNRERSRYKRERSPGSPHSRDSSDYKRSRQYNRGDTPSRERNRDMQERPRGMRELQNIGARNAFITSISGGYDSSGDIKLDTNYFSVKIDTTRVFYQYNISVTRTGDEPGELIPVDLKKIGKRQLLTIKKVIELQLRDKMPFVINMSNIYSQKDFSDEVINISGYVIKITKIKNIDKDSSAETYFTVMNSLLKQILESDLKLIPLGKSGMFDRSGSYRIPEYKIDIWPGLTANLLLSAQGKILINGFLKFRIFNYETAKNVIDKARDHRDAERDLIGKMITTTYGSIARNYIVKQIAWDMDPGSTFKQDGETISYQDYVKNTYSVTVTSARQPIIVAEPTGKRRDAVHLIPELCTLVGIQDNMRDKNKYMREVSKFTRVGANDRLTRVTDYIKRLSQDKSGVLRDWGISVENTPVRITGTRLKSPELIFKTSQPISVDSRGDWNKVKDGFAVPAVISRWTIVVSRNNKTDMEDFIRTFQRIADENGLSFKDPDIKEVQNDNDDIWESRLNSINPENKLIVCILPDDDKTRYNVVKETLTKKIGIISQCVIVGKLRDRQKSYSIMQKIVQQINAKMDGTAWKVHPELPPGRTMICAVEISWDKNSGVQASVAGFVATYDPDASKLFSRGLRIVSNKIADIDIAVGEALENFKTINGAYPNNVIIYRGGVGDTQLEAIADVEVNSVKKAFTSRGADIKLVFMIVQKNINMRMFSYNEREHKYMNPLPGSTTSDNDIVTIGRNLVCQEFHLVAQFVQPGATVCPSRYLILCNEIEAPILKLQQLTFTLCHNYPNWNGIVRVPGPLQCANKLSFHLTHNLGKTERPHKNLENRFYYL